VWLHEYLNEFPGKQDVLRYVLIATAPETKDNDFTWKDFQARNNNELVAILGNFINRTMVLTGNYFEGRVPEEGNLTDSDKEVYTLLNQSTERIGQSLDKFRFREALASVMDVARAGNKYLADHEPWKTIKTDKDRTATILHVSLEVAATLAKILEPFLPYTAATLRKMLNLEKQSWIHDAGNLLSAGHALGQVSLLFEKIEDDAISKQMEKLKASAEMNQAEKNTEGFKSPTSYDEFMKMDIRTGTILEAERVPKTDKLLKLFIDTGLDRRTVVSGIAADHTPESIIGKQVVLLANLEPRKIKGIESQGMILMTEDAEGKLVFVSPATSVPNGGIVK
jgi:methionyl-tRNA synthetase